MNKDNSKAEMMLFAFGSIAVIWFAIMVAPYASGGIPNILMNSSKIMDNPFHITWCKDSIKTIFIFLLIYIFGIGIYYSTKKEYRNGEEYGSAKWGNAKFIGFKYKQKPSSNNKLITQNLKLGLNIRKHKRNLNILVIGGSGTGKTRYFCKPNIMQCNTSYIVLDPKGEILRDTGNLLEKNGYEIRVLDLHKMDNSFGYNPFHYVKTDADLRRMVTNLLKNVTPKDTKANDPFWELTAKMLLMALVLYLKYEAPEDEQNFEMVTEMLQSAATEENDENPMSSLDILFDRLEMRDSEHIALKYYNNYKLGATKTTKSIQVTLASKLEEFLHSDVARATRFDEMDLTSIGEKKVALFIKLSDSDSSLNFMAGILYTQLFQELFNLADHKYKGALPVHVQLIMDEFANVALPDDFEKILSVMRSRNISASIILQNISQLKALYEKSWESIVGNCDTLLYLGGNEQSSHRYISELMGKQTIYIKNYGETKGRNGNSSINEQKVARDLMTPDEVRTMDNLYAIALVRGEKPIMDLKFNIEKHPNVKFTTDGNGEPYIFPKEDNISASIMVETTQKAKTTTSNNSIQSRYIVLDESQIEKILMEEKDDDKKTNNEQKSENGGRKYDNYE